MAEFTRVEKETMLYILMVQFLGFLRSFFTEMGVTPHEIWTVVELIRSEQGQRFQGPARSCPFGQIIQCDFEFVQLF